MQRVVDTGLGLIFQIFYTVFVKHIIAIRGMGMVANIEYLSGTVVMVLQTQKIYKKDKCG